MCDGVSYLSDRVILYRPTGTPAKRGAQLQRVPAAGQPLTPDPNGNLVPGDRRGGGWDKVSSGAE